MQVQSESQEQLAQHYLMGNYGPRDLTLVRGAGVYVWDSEGKRYLDFLSGIGVNNIGHCHPRVVEAVKRQAETLLHVSNLYLMEPQIQLGELLINNSPMDKVFFCNSGAEANEAAIKMARRYAHNHHGEGKYKIISLHHSFHGRTYGALSATGQPKYHEGFQPIVEGFAHVPINDVDAMKAAFDETVCAVLLEPVQGEGGIHPCSTAYLQAVRELCDQHGALLIFDEVQCGLGRSGHLFASDEFGVEPDAICLAKSLGGGIPIGAMLAKDHAAEVLVPGTHASTFGGNPVACAAAIATLKVILEENLVQRSHDLGGQLKARLTELQAKHESIQEVRGMGLMLGLEMKEPVKPVLAELRKQNILAGPAGPNVLRLLPPLIMDEAELFSIVERLDGILSN